MIMGQQIVEKLITELEFTTLNELKELISCEVMGQQSITKALSSLNKYNEVITFKIAQQTIYLSPMFYNKIGENK